MQTLTGIRASALLAAALAAAALLAWRGRARLLADAPAPEPASGRGSAGGHLRVQVPDLLLVSGLGLLLPLTPIVLARDFGLAPFTIGILMGGVALAKIAGTVVARLVARSRGSRRAITILLGAGAVSCLLLSAAGTLSLFVTALFATVLAVTGAWPLVVDSAQARVAPTERRRLTIRWNAREYLLIAATTAASGWLLTELGSAVPVFAVAALLFAGAAAAAAAFLGRALAPAAP